MIRETLIPPAVEPAQPPINIKSKSNTCGNIPHKPKSTVEYPVVVIIEDTVKNTLRIGTPRADCVTVNTVKIIIVALRTIPT